MNKFAEQILSVNGLVAYQDDSVVSKEIVKSEKGIVTVFAFDEGQALSEHTAPFDAIVHIVDGEAEILIDGKPYSLKSGEMIIMPANKPHAVKAVKRFKMMLVMVRG